MSIRISTYSTHFPAVTYQKCTVFTPTGLFHRRWKVLCCSAAPASELWKRRPWAPGRRKGPWALRNAKRELLRKRKPTRDDMVVEEECRLESAKGKKGGIR